MIKAIVLIIAVLVCCKAFPLFGIYVVSALGWCTDFIASIVPSV